MTRNSPGKDPEQTKDERELLQALLRSGLPLESEVAALLEKLGFSVEGEYQYMRPDTGGGLKEHSVDLRASKQIDGGAGQWATLELLVECKYNHPGCHWVFVPGKFSGKGYSGTASLHELFCPWRTRNRHLADVRLWEIDRRTERCVKGVFIHGKKNGGGADKNQIAIEHGLAQLRYAIPRLLTREYQFQAMGRADSQVQATVRSGRGQAPHFGKLWDIALPEAASEL